MLDQAIEKVNEVVDLCMDINNPLLDQTVNELYSNVSSAENVEEILEMCQEIRILVDEVVEDCDDKEDIISLFQDIDEMAE